MALSPGNSAKGIGPHAVPPQAAPGHFESRHGAASALSPPGSGGQREQAEGHPRARGSLLPWAPPDNCGLYVLGSATGGRCCPRTSTRTQQRGWDTVTKRQEGRIPAACYLAGRAVGHAGFAVAAQVEVGGTGALVPPARRKEAEVAAAGVVGLAGMVGNWGGAGTQPRVGPKEGTLRAAREPPTVRPTSPHIPSRSPCPTWRPFAITPGTHRRAGGRGGRCGCPWDGAAC